LAAYTSDTSYWNPILISSEASYGNLQVSTLSLPSNCFLYTGSYSGCTNDGCITCNFLVTTVAVCSAALQEQIIAASYNTVNATVTKTPDQSIVSETTPATSTPGSGGLSTNSLIAIIVGVVGGVLVLAVLIGVIVCQCRNKNRTTTNSKMLNSV